ncbi:MAG: VTT domain-containing protein [Patescibacteria group bacterium]|nr:VTT domain-containing protein [Patescibacteria group bacterium]MDD5715757.1 VTT domain-containing protein [Patescibacteria group bacterium]
MPLFIFIKIGYNIRMSFIHTAYDRVFRTHKDLWKTDLIIIGVFLALVLAFVVWNPSLPTKSDVTEWVSRFGASGPLALMLTVVIESIIAPLPGTFISIGAGVLYGVWPGMLYVWVANIIGSTCSFWIARKLGRPIVQKIIKERTIAKYDKFLRRNRFLVLAMYAVPIFPLDMFGYVIGLADMKYRRFLFIITVGFAINLSILTTFGSKLLSASGGARLGYAFIILLIMLVAVTVEKVFSKDTAPEA